MLVFLTSLRHPQSSRDYSAVERIFQRTLQSLCNQTSPRFRVIVACNQLPASTYCHPNVDYVLVDYPPYQDFPIDVPGVVKPELDKVTKLARALLHGRSLPATYYMPVDADDLVSNRLCNFAEQEPPCHGWFIDEGYVMNAGTGRVKKRYGLVRYCGTSIVYSSRVVNSLISIPAASLGTTEPTQLDLFQTFGSELMMALFDHSRTVRLFRTLGTPLRRLPFAGSVYVQDTGENMLGHRGETGGLYPPSDFVNSFVGDDRAFPTPEHHTYHERVVEQWQRIRSWTGSRMERGSSMLR